MENQSTTSDPRIRHIAPGGLPRESVDVDHSSEFAFLAQLFRQFERSGTAITDFAGETHSPTAFYMQGWRDAWITAARILDWTKETDKYVTAELAVDISTPVMALIESIMKTSSRSFTAGKDRKKNGIK
jgi:hypothetical protein